MKRSQGIYIYPIMDYKNRDVIIDGHGFQCEPKLFGCKIWEFSYEEN